jgi:hypothetical protein
MFFIICLNVKKVSDSTSFIGNMIFSLYLIYFFTSYLNPNEILKEFFFIN